MLLDAYKSFTEAVARKTAWLIGLVAVLALCSSTWVESQEVADSGSPPVKDTLLASSESQLTGIFAANARLARTINFGNMLEAPNEGDWGLSLEADYFAKAKAVGFTAVRLPVSWTHHAGREAPYTIDKSFFARVDWAVAQAKQQGLGIIVNMHHYDAIHKDPEAEKARFLAMWEQIAHRYKGEGPDIFFELLNEPHGVLTEQPELWNALLAEGVSVIRERNPERPVIVGPVGYNAIDYLEVLELPRDPNLIATVHFYNPFGFTHQGAEWVTPSPPVGMTWTGDAHTFAWQNWSWDTALNWTPDERGGEHLEVEFRAPWAGLYLHTDAPVEGYTTLYLEVNEAMRLSIDCGVAKQSLETLSGWHAYEVDLSNCPSVGDLMIQNDSPEAQPPFLMSGLELRKGGEVYPLIVSQKEAIANQLAQAEQWAKVQNLPLFLGEFGAYDKADTPSRVRWTRVVREAAERSGLSWAYWEFGAGFGIYNPGTDAWRSELLEALLP